MISSSIQVSNGILLINETNDYLSNYYLCQYTYNVFGRFLILCHSDRQTINALKIEQAMYVLFAKRVFSWESRVR